MQFLIDAIFEIIFFITNLCFEHIVNFDSLSNLFDTLDLYSIDTPPILTPLLLGPTPLDGKQH